MFRQISPANTQERVQPTHHIIAQIQKEIRAEQNISFVWTSGHASIPGNEKADELATTTPTTTFIKQ